MPGLIISINKVEQIKQLKKNKNIKRYLLGNNDYANRMPFSATIEDIKQAIGLKDPNNQEIYVCITKIFHENEIANLTSYLEQLKETAIDGIIFSDFAVYQIVKNMNWKINLSYSTDTTITNASFTQLAQQMNIQDIELAKEITLKEILQINEKKKSKITVFLHGHIYMYNSPRKLISTYLNTIKQNTVEMQNKISNNLFSLYDEERDSYYKVIENEKGTNILSSDDQQSFKIFLKLLQTSIDYYKIDGFGYKNDDVIKVINYYTDLISFFKDNQINENFEENFQILATNYLEKIKKEIPYKKFNTGFLQKRTVY